MFGVLNTIYNDKDMSIVDHTDITIQCLCSGFSQWYHWLVTFVPLVPITLPVLQFAPISLPMVQLLIKLAPMVRTMVPLENPEHTL